MRVAVLNRSFSRTGGGAESYSVAVVTELARHHEIHVFSQETDEPVSGVSYHRIACISPKPRWVNQLLFAVLTWWKTRAGFDIVHSHENTWHGQVQTIHVRTVHHNLFHHPGIWRKCLGWLQVVLSPRLLTYVLLEASRFRNAADRQIVMASDLLKVECQAVFPNCTLAQWTTIAPGVTLPEVPTDVAHFRKEMGLPVDVPLILFVANDYARKGLGTLVQALARMNGNVHLAVAGHTGQKAHFQALATEFGVGLRVHFLGPLADLSPAYFSADVLAHPTREDSYGMVVLEAMAHRLPVIVSNAMYCGVASDLTHQKNSFILENPSDASELAELLQGVLSMAPPSLASLKANAFNFAVVHSWHAVALKYDAIYQQVFSQAKA